MKKKWLTACLLTSVWASAQVLPGPARLRTDLLLNTGKLRKAGMPVAGAVQNNSFNAGYQFANIYQQNPVLHWETGSLIQQNIAYEIQLASSVALLQNGKADYWLSGKISSRQNTAAYTGKPLQPGKTYFWKVRVWNEKNKVSSFSDASTFFLKETDTAEAFAFHPLAASIQKPEKISRNKEGSYFLDFGKDAFGQVLLRLNSPRADSIWIEAAEALESPGMIQRKPGNIRYIKRSLYVEKGIHDYKLEWPEDVKRNSRNPVQMPAYIGEVYPFRYLAISGFSGTLDAASVQRKIVYYPFNEQASSFVSSDTVLNQVWDLCKYSMKATSFSGYYIDGDRERLPYEADALINQLSHYAVDAEYSIARRSMAFLLFHPTWPTEWSLQNILLAWNDYLYTGDDGFLKKYYSELQRKILVPLAGADGLISTKAKKQEDAFLESIHMVKDFDGKHGLKDIVDWPQRSGFTGTEKEYDGETDGFVFTNYNAPVNAFYYRTLVLMSQIALVLGKPADASFYLDKASRVYESFQKVFVNPQTGLVKDGDTTRHTSLHANMFALAFGLVSKEHIGQVGSFIKSRKMACSVYGAQFLLDALYDAGEDEYALSLMNATTQRSWYNMIRTGATISMEAWDKLYKPNLDWNHAWGAAPANIIVRKLMGVEPLTPGAEKIRIKPQLGSLRFARLKTTTIQGEVMVECTNSDTAIMINCTIPGSTSADLFVKSITGKQTLLVDGKLYTALPEDGFYKIPDLPAGKHQVKLQ